MKRLRGLNSRRLLISALVLLVLSVVLLVWARDIIRETIVLPLSYLVYAANILIDTTPQVCFWFGSVIICLYIAYRSLARKRRKATDIVPSLAMYPSYYETQRPGPQPGRFDFWIRKVLMMRRGSSAYYQNNFENALGRLLLDVLAYRHKLTVVEVEARLRTNTLDVPADVRDYLLLHSQAKPVVSESFSVWLKDQLMMRVYRLFDGLQNRLSPRGRQRTDTPAEQRAQRILAYIEDELEVTDGSI